MPILPPKIRAKLRSARLWHRWLGIPLCLVLLLSALSGILLNHRDVLSDTNIPRAMLPGSYDYVRWSAGLGRGVLSVSEQTHYIYGQDGVWVTTSIQDSSSRAISFNEGLPLGADRRKVVAMLQDQQRRLWLTTPQDLYTYDRGKWRVCPVSSRQQGRLTDLQIVGDTLVLMSRSHIYTTRLTDSIHALPWQRHELQAPEGYTGELLLFRFVWALHSGEYFGRIGQFVVDLIGVITILLCLTGLAYMILRLRLQRSHGRQHKRSTRHTAKALSRQHRWHSKIGYWLFFPVLFVLISGWFLRPPMMLPLIWNKLKPWQISSLSSDNPWHERLRALRYDDETASWLLSTSEGFYQLSSWESQPTIWSVQPPVSPMGINVFERAPKGSAWLIGSFSGLYTADPNNRLVQDYLSKQPIETSGIHRPISDMLISGVAEMRDDTLLVFTYDQGVQALSHTSDNHLDSPPCFVSQPAEANDLPYSLWQYALEVHTGRIYHPILGSLGVDLFVFILGLTTLILLITGYKRSRR